MNLKQEAEQFLTDSQKPDPSPPTTMAESNMYSAGPPKQDKPDYEDLWLDLYEFVISRGYSASYWRSIMEEMDPTLLED